MSRSSPHITRVDLRVKREQVKKAQRSVEFVRKRRGIKIESDFSRANLKEAWMRRIVVVLMAVIAVASLVNYMGPASGQANMETRDELASKLTRREVQRAPLSIPGREMVQVETLIPAGVASGWHIHPGEEVGYIVAGQVEMRVQGRATVVLKPGEGFLIPPRTPHNARDLGPETGRMLSTYIVETGQPIASFVSQPVPK
jgi:quercetin dioxygenase-like cupin family protein